ncbi:hypothetical protein VIGAN_04310500, partial [Vigna angularis var. angularis]
PLFKIKNLTSITLTGTRTKTPGSLKIFQEFAENVKQPTNSLIHQINGNKTLYGPITNRLTYERLQIQLNQKYPNADTQLTDFQLFKPPVQDPEFFFIVLPISENSNQEPTLGLRFR